MSNITLEQVDLIMQRANVSYTEAKEALEHCNGDVVEALLYLEKAEKIHSQQGPTTSTSDKITSFINKLNATTFIMKKGDHTYVNVPLSVALIFGILSFYVSILSLVVALICGVKVHIVGENDLASKINSTLDDFKK